MNKYKFTGNRKTVNGVKLRQIVRLEDNLIGGWIEKEGNLSQWEDCFVYDNAIVYGDAQIYDNVQVHGNAKVYDNAEVYGNAQIYDNVQISGNAKVYGDAKVYDTAKIYSEAQVYDNAKVYGNAKVYDDAKVYDNAEVYGNTKVYSDAKVNKNVSISQGDIIGDVQVDFDSVEFYKSCDSKLVTAITKNGKTLFNIGCQKLITKEKFIDRIHNEDGGLDKNPHRRFYLKVLNLY